MKYLALVFVLAVTGCSHSETAAQEHSPYECYLPQVLPSETNRVESAAGYSIVSPVGWAVRPIPVNDIVKGNITDQLVIEGHESDQLPPRITILHLGSNENALYYNWLKEDSWNALYQRWFKSAPKRPDEWKHTQFQGQPALTCFLADSGSNTPYLSQFIFCERDGNGFILCFGMRNADKDKPYFTCPVPIIEKYFETFRYKAPKK